MFRNVFITDKVYETSNDAGLDWHIFITGTTETTQEAQLGPRLDLKLLWPVRELLE